MPHESYQAYYNRSQRTLREQRAEIEWLRAQRDATLIFLHQTQGIEHTGPDGLQMLKYIRALQSAICGAEASVCKEKSDD